MLLVAEPAAPFSGAAGIRAQSKLLDQEAAEPCAMCAGAIYWAGIGRVVYGQSERSLGSAIGDHPENPTLDLPCRTVFAAGRRKIEVIGPMLEDEAAALQSDFWRRTQPKPRSPAQV
jgi:Cytidine and deoxycytidylate deaminase zinc-binding region